jgi:hypothetical protein
MPRVSSSLPIGLSLDEMMMRVNQGQELVVAQFETEICILRKALKQDWGVASKREGISLRLLEAVGVQWRPAISLASLHPPNRSRQQVVALLLAAKPTLD